MGVLVVFIALYVRHEFRGCLQVSQGLAGLFEGL